MSFFHFFILHTSAFAEETHKENIPQPFTLSWDKNHFHIYLLLSLFLSELLLRFSSLPFCFSDLCLSETSSPRLFFTDPSVAEDSSRSLFFSFFSSFSKSLISFSSFFFSFSFSFSRSFRSFSFFSNLSSTGLFSFSFSLSASPPLLRLGSRSLLSLSWLLRT